MRPNRLCLHAVGLLLLALLASPVLAQHVTGWNVERMEFGHDGERSGEFRQIAPGRWVEYGDGYQYQYEEGRRDDGSVYLEDRQRRVSLRLNLDDGQAWYRSRGGDWEPRYSIWGGRAGAGHGRSAPVARCFQAVQGRIAWDYEGNRQWEPGNMATLCQGAEDSAEPARCFQQAMHGGIDWGGGTRWEWENAIALCQGSRNARATIGCFESQLDEGYGWEEAIAECGR